MTRTIYIKPMTWAGELRYYVGDEPSKPHAAPGHRLGSYFIRTKSLVSARCMAEYYANGKCSVVECDHYVGL